MIPGILRRSVMFAVRYSLPTVSVPSVAWTQAASPAQDAQPPSPPPPFTAGWQDGFIIQSANGDFKLQLGMTASLVLTGEAASDRGVRPKRTFDPANGSWGALQILGRMTALAVDRQAFESGLADAKASRAATSFTVAANWYPTAYIKYYATFERTVFDGPHDPPRPAENVILFRVQLAF